MEIGYYDNHGKIDKITFKIPRKLKKKMKKKIEDWREFKNFYVTKQVQEHLERFF